MTPQLLCLRHGAACKVGAERRLICASQSLLSMSDLCTCSCTGGRVACWRVSRRPLSSRLLARLQGRLPAGPRPAGRHRDGEGVGHQDRRPQEDARAVPAAAVSWRRDPGVSCPQLPCGCHSACLPPGVRCWPQCHCGLVQRGGSCRCRVEEALGGENGADRRGLLDHEHGTEVSLWHAAPLEDQLALDVSSASPVLQRQVVC